MAKGDPSFQSWNKRTKCYTVFAQGGGILDQVKEPLEGVEIRKKKPEVSPKLPDTAPKYNPDTNSDEPAEIEVKKDQEETPEPKEEPEENPWLITW